jgi:kumamolisin
VTLAGTAAAMEKAFGVELNEFEHPEGTYRGHTGPLQMPEEYASLVSGVFGLDDRPVARPHFRYYEPNSVFGARASSLSFDPPQVGKLYGFPEGVDVSGQTIGLIELGGGYRPADITKYFKGLGRPAPSMKSISVDHGRNHPSTAQRADGEVMLDIEVAGAVAPGITIAVYFAPNTSQGFQDALSTAIHDQLNKPCTVSISWGGPENGWTQQSMQNLTRWPRRRRFSALRLRLPRATAGQAMGVQMDRAMSTFQLRRRMSWLRVEPA